MVRRPRVPGQPASGIWVSDNEQDQTVPCPTELQNKHLYKGIRCITAHWDNDYEANLWDKGSEQGLSR